MTLAPRRAALVALAAISMTLAVSAPAFAHVHAHARHTIGFLPSRTTLTSDSQAVLPDGSVTVTASVRPGFLVESTGTVTFTDTTNGAALGSAPVGASCYQVTGPCTAEIDVDASSLATGANIITGTYSGDPWLRPSAGTTVLFLETQTTTDGVTTTTCGFSCTTGGQTSPDTSTELDISAPAGQNATITDSFSTDPLPCSTLDAGDTVVFSATGLTANKIVVLQVFGDAADTMESTYFGGEHLCYESPRRFTTAPTGAPATLDPTTGLYEGLLPQCEERGGGGETTLAAGGWGHALNPPCVDFSEFYGDDTDIYTQQFETTASDPRASN